MKMNMKSRMEVVIKMETEINIMRINGERLQ